MRTLNDPFSDVLRGESVPLDRIAQTWGLIRGPLKRAGQGVSAATVQSTTTVNAPAGFTDAQMSDLESDIYRRGWMQDIPFLAQVTASRLLPVQQTRSYLFIQNQSSSDEIVVRFGQAPAFGPGQQALGVTVPPSFGFYEPILIPRDEVWIIGSIADVPGILLYATF